MNIATALSSVKTRLGIPSSVTSFDTSITEFINSGVRRLYPRAKMEVGSQEPTSFTVDNLGEVDINIATLTTPLASARKVEVFDGYSWSSVSDTYHQATSLRLRGITPDISKIRIYGLKRFATIDDVYEELLQGVIWWAMSEFYDYLAGYKKGYNIYMQTSGARAVDNMADQSAYYDSKANQFIDEQAKDYGG